LRNLLAFLLGLLFILNTSVSEALSVNNIQNFTTRTEFIHKSFDGLSNSYTNGVRFLIDYDGLWLIEIFEITATENISLYKTKTPSFEDKHNMDELILTSEGNYELRYLYDTFTRPKVLTFTIDHSGPAFFNLSTELAYTKDSFSFEIHDISSYKVYYSFIEKLEEKTELVAINNVFTLDKAGSFKIEAIDTLGNNSHIFIKIYGLVDYTISFNNENIRNIYNCDVFIKMPILYADALVSFYLNGVYITSRHELMITHEGTFELRITNSYFEDEFFNFIIDKSAPSNIFFSASYLRNFISGVWYKVNTYAFLDYEAAYIYADFILRIRIQEVAYNGSLIIPLAPSDYHLSDNPQIDVCYIYKNLAGEEFYYLDLLTLDEILSIDSSNYIETKLSAFDGEATNYYPGSVALNIANQENYLNNTYIFNTNIIIGYDISELFIPFFGNEDHIKIFFKLLDTDTWIEGNSIYENGHYDVKLVDKAGNENIFKIFLDKTAPFVENLSYKNNDVVTININETNSFSAQLLKEDVRGNVLSVQVFNDSFKVNDNGFYRLCIIDSAGNLSPIYSFSIVKDLPDIEYYINDCLTINFIIPDGLYIVSASIKFKSTNSLFFVEQVTSLNKHEYYFNENGLYEIEFIDSYNRYFYESVNLLINLENIIEDEIVDDTNNDPNKDFVISDKPNFYTNSSNGRFELLDNAVSINDFWIEFEENDFEIRNTNFELIKNLDTFSLSGKYIFNILDKRTNLVSYITIYISSNIFHEEELEDAPLMYHNKIDEYMIFILISFGISVFIVGGVIIYINWRKKSKEINNT